MNHIRKLDPVAQQQAELNLVRHLADIAILAGIRQCEDLVGIPHSRRYRHRQSPSPSPSVRRPTKSLASSAAPSLPFPCDEALAESARMAIARGGFGSGARIAVTVTNGWLILEGEVDSTELRNELDAVARGLNGVSGVSNRVVLANDALARRVRQKILESFMADARAQAFRVRVDAVEQTIVLSGSARSAIERDEAEKAAWLVPGTEAVVNEIQLCVLHAAAGSDITAHAPGGKLLAA